MGIGGTGRKQAGRSGWEMMPVVWKLQQVESHAQNTEYTVTEAQETGVPTGNMLDTYSRSTALVLRRRWGQSDRLAQGICLACG